MKKFLLTFTLLLCVASSCFAAEERTTKDIFADTTIANVVITGDQLRVRTHPDLDGYIIKKLERTERIPGSISLWKTVPWAGYSALTPGLTALWNKSNGIVRHVK